MMPSIFFICSASLSPVLFLPFQIVPADPELQEMKFLSQTVGDFVLQDLNPSLISQKPKQAAGIFEEMDSDLELVARILNAMSADQRGAILGVMDAEIAAKLTKIMDPAS